MIKVVDEVATGASPRTRDAMHHTFKRASQLEWMFWHSAHDLNEWPV